MKPTPERQDEARRLIERLVKIAPDASTTARAKEIRARLKLPMSVVIDKIPGAHMTAKAASVGVTRQSLYYWLNGTTRPSQKQAKAIAALTGFDAEEIRGR